MQVIEYLDKKGYQFKITGNEANLNCPFCDDREYKFYVNISTGAYQCKHANRCNAAGNFYQLQKELGDTPHSLNNDRFSRDKKVYAKPGKLERYSEVQKEFIKFFLDRGISDETLKKHKIKVVENKWIMFPVIKNDNLVNRKYRTLDKKFKAEKDAELCLIGREHISDTADYLIICEGEIDMLTWSQLGYSVVSVPSGIANLQWIENDFDYLQRFKTIYLSMDMDSIGREKTKEIAARLGKWRCYDIQLPYKDANECLMKGITDFSGFIDNAKSYQMPELKSVSAFIDRVMELIENPDKNNGISTGFSQLDNIIKGWRPGEMTVWTGKAGSGKSTFMNQIVMKIISNHQLPICMGSFEMPAERTLSWLTAGERPDQTRGMLEALSDYFYLIDVTGEIKPSYLMDIMQFGAMKYGIKHFVVDSLMKLKVDKRYEYRDQTEICNMLIEFASEYKCHVHLIAHPRKTDRDTDIVGSSDISGTGNITNLAHNVIVMHRYTPEKKEQIKNKSNHAAPDNVLLVKKCREFGNTGNIHLKFNQFNKQFFEIEHREER